MTELWRFEQMITLASTGNYRRAADKLGITHGALSQTIAKLEREYDTSLFQRHKRATVPTAYGETLLRAAREAVGIIAQARDDMSLMRNLQTGRLIVGIDPVLSEGLLAPSLAALLQNYPSLQFTTLPMNWRSMDEALATNGIDIYIGLGPDQRSDRFDYRDFRLAPPVFAARTGHEVLQGGTLTIEDLIRFPFGGGDVPDWLLMQFMASFPEHLPSLRSVRGMFLTTSELGLMRQLLSTTDIIGLVPEAIIRSEVSAGRVTILPAVKGLAELTITGVVATREDRPLSPAAAQLSQIVLSIANIGWKLYESQNE
jgi:DNA-binding transcriptional LysR family regulator|tara:strand:+ start:545 stop:1486 length:942 start_codon:yes stop_codon:yes gene_type:complete